MESQLLRQVGRIVAGGYGDYQQVRQQMMNRIRVLVRAKNEGLSFDKPEEKKEERDFDAKYQDGNLLSLLEEMIKAGKITDAEYDYLKKAIELAQKAMSLEKSFVSPMGKLIEAEPLWTEFLFHVRGIGPVIAAKLMAKIGDCSRYDRVSALWRHFGLHIVCPVCVEKVGEKTLPKLVNSDGRCQCGRSGVAPKRRRGQGIDFDNRLRSLAWNIGGSLMKQKSPIYYDKIYSQEKARQISRIFAKGELAQNYGAPYKENDVALKPIHAHNRALRKMVKIFLQHCWVVSRGAAGLSLTDPYVQEKLGHSDIISPEDVLKANGKTPEEMAA